jgi:hypothetical protein
MTPTSEAQIAAPIARTPKIDRPPHRRRQSPFQHQRLPPRPHAALSSSPKKTSKPTKPMLWSGLIPEMQTQRETPVVGQWRLNRIRGIEDGMFALGHLEPTANIDVDHPQIHAALTASNVFRQDSQAFVNLTPVRAASPPPTQRIAPPAPGAPGQTHRRPPSRTRCCRRHPKRPQNAAPAFQSGNRHHPEWLRFFARRNRIRSPPPTPSRRRETRRKTRLRPQTLPSIAAQARCLTHTGTTKPGQWSS